jgi:hypothetical protein
MGDCDVQATRKIDDALQFLPSGGRQRPRVVGPAWGFAAARHHRIGAAEQ